MKAAAIIGLLLFAAVSADADDSLGKSLIDAVRNGDVAQTRQLVEQWRGKLAEITGFKIGIAWQGNPEYGADRFRSIPLAEFAPLARVPSISSR